MVSEHSSTNQLQSPTNHQHDINTPRQNRQATATFSWVVRPNGSDRSILLKPRGQHIASCLLASVRRHLGAVGVGAHVDGLDRTLDADRAQLPVLLFLKKVVHVALRELEADEEAAPRDPLLAPGSGRRTLTRPTSGADLAAIRLARRHPSRVASKLGRHSLA